MEQSPNRTSKVCIYSKRAVERDSRLRRGLVSCIEIELAAGSIRRRGDVGVVGKGLDIAARRERGGVLADDEAAVLKILEAGDAVLQARHEVADKHVAFVDLHAVDAGFGT